MFLDVLRIKFVDLCAYRYEVDDAIRNLLKVFMTTILMIDEVGGINFQLSDDGDQTYRHLKPREVGDSRIH